MEIRYFGDVAEWLGRGLQSLLRRFESARHLRERPLGIVPVGVFVWRLFLGTLVVGWCVRVATARAGGAVPAASASQHIPEQASPPEGKQCRRGPLGAGGDEAAVVLVHAPEAREYVLQKAQAVAPAAEQRGVHEDAT